MTAELVIGWEKAIDASFAENVSVFLFALSTLVNVTVETHSVVPAPEEARSTVLAVEMVVEGRKFAFVLILHGDGTVVEVLNTRLAVGFWHVPILAGKTFSAFEVAGKTVVVNFTAFFCAVSKRSVFLVPVESVFANRADVIEVEEHVVFVPFCSNEVVLGVGITVLKYGLADSASGGRPEPRVAFSAGGVFIANGAVFKSCRTVSASACGDEGWLPIQCDQCFIPVKVERSFALLANIVISNGVNSIVFRINITIIKHILTTLAVIRGNLVWLFATETSLTITVGTSLKLLRAI